MNFKIGPLASDIIIVIYILTSLFYRIKLEFEQHVSTLNSIIIGGSFILILWVLIKLKILNPNWFGFFKIKNNQ